MAPTWMTNTGRKNVFTVLNLQMSNYYETDILDNEGLVSGQALYIYMARAGRKASFGDFKLVA